MYEHQVYTAGYQGATVLQLCDALTALNAKLLDIRHTPWSRRPEWCQVALAHGVGVGRYVHLPALGNLHHRDRGAGIEIANLELGIRQAEHHAAQQPVLLLCVCADYWSCHRKVVARALADRGWTVRDIELGDRSTWPGGAAQQGSLFDE